MPSKESLQGEYVKALESLTFLISLKILKACQCEQGVREWTLPKMQIKMLKSQKNSAHLHLIFLKMNTHTSHYIWVLILLNSS